jgi:hypothetical protein
MIFKVAFAANDLPYRKPHTFRHTITRKMMLHPQSPLYISALAQNLGQEKDQGVLIANYGTRPEHERAGILKGYDLE